MPVVSSSSTTNVLWQQWQWWVRTAGTRIAGGVYDSHPEPQALNHPYARQVFAMMTSRRASAMATSMAASQRHLAAPQARRPSEWAGP